MVSFFKAIPILCYHDVGTPGGHPLAIFENHLSFLKDKGYKTISVRKLYRIVKGKEYIDDKYVVLTFDDCHLSNWKFAVPLLQKYGFRAVFFAVSDFIVEGRVRHPKEITDLKKLSTSFRLALEKKDYSQFMTLQELRALIEDFGHEVYSHSKRHQGCFKNLEFKGVLRDKSHWSVWGIYEKPQDNYPFFDIGSAYAYDGFWPVKEGRDKIEFRRRTEKERYEFCCKDFQESLARIKEVNKQDEQFFCWPWGHFDQVSLKALKTAGYKGAFTLERFRNGYGTNPYYFHRLGIGRKKDVNWLRTRLIMHGNLLSSMIFFKFFRKKKEDKKTTTYTWELK